MALLTETVKKLETKVNIPAAQINEMIKNQISHEVEKLKTALLEKKTQDDAGVQDKFMDVVKSQISEEIRSAINVKKDTVIQHEDNVWSDKEKVQVMKSSLMVKPNGEGIPMDMDKIKQIVVANGIPVNSIKVSQKGETFVNLPNLPSRDKLTPLLQTEESFHEVVNVKSKLPTISLLRVTEAISPQEIKDCLYKQNINIKTLMDAKSHLSVIFTKPPGENQEYHQVAIRVSPEIRKSIAAYGNTVHIKGNRYRVDDRFYIKRCNRCQQFHHYADKCDLNTPEICGFCTEHHKSNDCPIRTEDHREHQCINCKVANMEFKGHPTFWRKCPSYMAQQLKLKNSISYNYLN